MKNLKNALLLAGFILVSVMPAYASMWGGAEPVQEDEDKAFKAASEMFQSENADKLAVVQTLEKYLSRYISSPRWADAEFLIGQANLEYAVSILKAENDSKHKSAARLLSPPNPVATEALANARRAFERVADDRKESLAPSAQYRLGEVAYDEKNWNKSIEEFQLVSKKFPKSYLLGESLLGIIYSDLALEQFPVAEANIFLLGETFPIYMKEPDVLYAQGIVALHKGDYETSEKSLKLIKTPEAQYYLGKSYILSNKPYLAAATFESLLHDYPNSDLIEDAQFFIGDSFFLAKDYDGAISKYQDFLSKYPDSSYRVSAMFRIGSCYFEKQDFIQARANFQAVLDRYPRDFFAPLAQYFIAESYMTAGQMREALFAYSKTITQYPDDLRVSPLARFKLAWTQLQVSDTAQAIDTCQNFLALYPSNALAKDIYLLMGNAFIKLERHGEAMVAFQRILDLAPTSNEAEQALFSILQDQFNQKSYSSILTSYQYLLRHMPPSRSKWRSFSYLYAAEAYLSLGEADEAKRIYEMILKVYPDDLASLYAQDGIAWCYSYKGEDQKAIEARQKLKDMLSVASSSLTFSLNGLGIADSMFNQKNYDDAYQLYDQFATQNPGTPDAATALYRAGLSLYHERYYTEAIQTWQKLITTYPKAPEAATAAYQLADTLFRAQKYSESVASYQDIIKNYPDSPQLPTAYLRIAQAAYNSKNDNAAIAQIKDLLKRFPKAPEVSDAMDILEAIFDRSPNIDFKATLSALIAEDPASPVAAEAQFRIGRRCFETKDYTCAADELHKFSVNYTDNAQLPKAQFLSGESYFNQNKYDQAIPAFERLLSNFDKSDDTPLALFHVASAYYGQKKYEDALKYYNQLVDLYPKSDYIKPAEFNMALCYKSLGRLDEAQAAYSRYAALSGGAGASAQSAQWEIYSIQKERKDYDSALATLNKIRTSAASGSDDAMEATYRMSEIYQEAGRSPEALQTWQTMEAMKPANSPFRLQALIKLAEASEKSGDIKSAIYAYDDLARNATKDLAHSAAERAAALRKMKSLPAAAAPTAQPSKAAAAQSSAASDDSDDSDNSAPANKAAPAAAPAASSGKSAMHLPGMGGQPQPTAQ